jgi:hypothetical protein
LDRVMKKWLCTSKEDLIHEAEARSWDDTLDNVCHRTTMCDHLLEFKTWRITIQNLSQRGISFATATRHLRILRRRLEKLMGKSARELGPPWYDLPEGQWELLCEGETTWKKYETLLWETGYKTVTLFPGVSTTPLHPTLRMTGDGSQDPPHPGSPYKTNTSVREKDHSIIPKHGGLETPSRGRPTAGVHRLVHLTGVHPVAGTTENQRYPPTRGGRANL